MSTMSQAMIKEIQRKASLGIPLDIVTPEKQALYNQYTRPVEPTPQPTTQFDIGQFASSFGDVMNNNMQNTMNSYMNTMGIQNQNLFNQFNQSNQQMLQGVSQSNTALFDSMQRKLSQQNVANANRDAYSTRPVVGGMGIQQQPQQPQQRQNGFTQQMVQRQPYHQAVDLWKGSFK